MGIRDYSCKTWLDKLYTAFSDQSEVAGKLIEEEEKKRGETIEDIGRRGLISAQEGLNEGNDLIDQYLLGRK